MNDLRDEWTQSAGIQLLLIIYLDVFARLNTCQFLFASMFNFDLFLFICDDHDLCNHHEEEENEMTGAGRRKMNSLIFISRTSDSRDE